MSMEKLYSYPCDSTCASCTAVSDANSASCAVRFAIGSNITQQKYFISKDIFKNYNIPGSIKYIDFKHNGEVKEVYIKEVLYSKPVTVVFWSDGTRTSSKSDSFDNYNPYAGLAFCVLKKMYGGDEVAALIETWGPGILELPNLFEANAKKKPFRKTLAQIRKKLRLKERTEKTKAEV